MHLLGLTSLFVASMTLVACSSATPPTAPNAMLVDATTSQPQTGMGVARAWVGVGHSARGSVSFSVQNGVGRLDFSDDFAVSGVPDPYVYVNTTNNANTGRPLRVSALRNNGGAQSYSFQLPPGVTYAWVLIWCDRFNVAVAEAPIPVAP